VQVTSTTFLPLLVSLSSEKFVEEPVKDELLEGVSVVYSFGPPHGSRLVTWTDLPRLNLEQPMLRRQATANLTARLGAVKIHGQAPSLMLSFDGLESSLLLADGFWESLRESVPGELVIGVPARDVVIVTGSESKPGLEKAKRAVDRVFFAGDEHLITRDLLVRRNGGWEPLSSRPAVARNGAVPLGARPAGRPMAVPAPRAAMVGGGAQRPPLRPDMTGGMPVVPAARMERPLGPDLTGGVPLAPAARMIGPEDTGVRRIPTGGHRPMGRPPGPQADFGYRPPAPPVRRPVDDTAARRPMYDTGARRALEDTASRRALEDTGVRRALTDTAARRIIESRTADMASRRARDERLDAELAREGFRGPRRSHDGGGRAGYGVDLSQERRERERRMERDRREREAPERDRRPAPAASLIGRRAAERPAAGRFDDDLDSRAASWRRRTDDLAPASRERWLDREEPANHRGAPPRPAREREDARWWEEALRRYEPRGMGEPAHRAVDRDRDRDSGFGLPIQEKPKVARSWSLAEHSRAFADSAEGAVVEERVSSSRWGSRDYDDRESSWSRGGRASDLLRSAGLPRPRTAFEG
jgi:hypothetical protein